MALPTTRERVPSRAAEGMNRGAALETGAGVGGVKSCLGRCPERRAELDAEWDIERAIEANASVIAFLGVLLGAFVHPYWLVLPALVTAFLFQHAIQGWCPPVPVLRRLGFRTADEISEERQALKAIRGDFDSLPDGPDRVSAALTAARS